MTTQRYLVVMGDPRRGIIELYLDVVQRRRGTSGHRPAEPGASAPLVDRGKDLVGIRSGCAIEPIRADSDEVEQKLISRPEPRLSLLHKIIIRAPHDAIEGSLRRFRFHINEREISSVSSHLYQETSSAIRRRASLLHEVEQWDSAAHGDCRIARNPRQTSAAWVGTNASNRSWLR